jgi:GAF domain-containing protein
LSALTRALIGFARTLAAGYDVSDVLHDLPDRVTSVLNIAGAGVSVRHDGAVRFVTVDHETIAALERVAEENDQGPCVDAIGTGQRVLISRLGDHAARWPDYTAKAAKLGIVAVAAIPMRNAARIGALDLFDTSEHHWTQEEVDIADVFADIATAYVLHASQLERDRRTIEQLQHALDSRVIIEQAKGILAGERKISIDQAFALLRKHANDRNATLRAVAEAVVHLGLRP